MKPTEILKRDFLATKVEFRPWWNQRKSVHKATRQIMANAVSAQASSIGASKVIYSTGIESIAAVNSLKEQIDAWWKANTLPYGQESVRLLKKDSLEEFKAKMEQFTQDLAIAAQAVEGDRDKIIADAQTRLQDAFSLGDYPLDLSSLYGVEVGYPNLTPNAELPPAVYEIEQKRLQAKIEEAAVLAQEAFTQQFAELVSHLAERLEPGPDGKKKVFKNTAVENLQGFFDTFAKLKISDGSDLEALITQAKELLHGISPQELRDGKLLKTEIAQGLKDIETKLAPLVTTAPRRKILKPLMDQTHEPSNTAAPIPA